MTTLIIINHITESLSLSSQCKLELKPLEPVYSDVRVVIPQLEYSLSVQFDQFSLVGDVLNQVLQLAQPKLDPREDYTLNHVRLRMRYVYLLPLPPPPSPSLSLPPSLPEPVYSSVVVSRLIQ